MRRFRRIDITLPAPAAIAWGPDVLRVEKSGTNVSFVHQRFAGDDTLAALHAKLPPAASIETSPLTLRDIYLALVRKSPSVLP